ncbi:MAG: hypothetical protein LBS90_06855 [Oscillospiraceae bacterium]|nr:hypothetical protein [Oscillospiraceae bacterium]
MTPERSTFTRIVGALIALAIVSAALLTLYNSALNPLKLARVAALSVRRDAAAYGYIVRGEKAFAQTSGYTVPEVREGEKLASGQLAATVYEGDSDTAEAIRREKLALDSLVKSSKLDEASRSEAAKLAVTELCAAIAGRDLADASDKSAAAETYALAASGTALESEIARREAALLSLESELRGVSRLFAEESGIFSSRCDGFESVTADMCREITPAALRQLFAAPDEPSGAKLILGFRWYLAAEVDANDASRIRERGSADVVIPQLGSRQYRMTVQSSGSAEGGKCVLLLYCDAHITDTLGRREVAARIVFEDESGFAVPKEAIRVDSDGGAYVYLAVTETAVRLDVDIAASPDERTYLIRPRTYPDLNTIADKDARAAVKAAGDRNAERAVYLRDGSEVVVRAAKLSDGKVIR